MGSKRFPDMRHVLTAPKSDRTFTYVLAHGNGRVPRRNRHQRPVDYAFKHSYGVAGREAALTEFHDRYILRAHPEWRGRSVHKLEIRRRTHGTTLAGEQLPWGYMHRPDVIWRLSRTANWECYR